MAVELNVGRSSVAYAEAAKAPVRTEPKERPEPEAKPVVQAEYAEAKPAVQAEYAEADKDGENTSRRIKSAVEHANTALKHAKTKCEFSYHEETKRVSIKVIDEETEEVVKEIPPEETLEMIAKMWELAGILVDEKR